MINHKGKVWIEDGNIRCLKSPYRYPLLTVGDTIILYKNGVRVTGTLTVSEEDQLVAEVREEIIPTTWEWDQNDDGTELAIKVVPGRKIIRRLKNHPPSTHIVLSEEEIVLSCNSLQREEIEGRLRQLNVGIGIQQENIEQACHTLVPARFILARGEKAVRGRNGWLHIRHTTPGETEARVIPPEMGKPGMTVYGKRLPTVQGSPYSGRIRLEGRIELSGDVEAGTEIEVRGDVHLTGALRDSAMTATGLIHLAGAAEHSRLHASKNALGTQMMLESIGQISAAFKQISSSIRMLFFASAFKTTDLEQTGFRKLLGILLDNKFKHVPALLEQCRCLIKDEQMQGEWERWLERYARGIGEPGQQLLERQEDLDRLVEQTELFLQTERAKPEGGIRMSCAKMSEIRCGGDIALDGDCARTEIRSEGRIHIAGNISGSILYAAKGAVLGRVEPLEDSPTRVVVPGGLTVCAGFAAAGTIFESGNETYVLKESAEDVQIRRTESSIWVLE